MIKTWSFPTDSILNKNIKEQKTLDVTNAFFAEVCRYFASKGFTVKKTKKRIYSWKGPWELQFHFRGYRNNIQGKIISVSLDAHISYKDEGTGKTYFIYWGRFYNPATKEYEKYHNLINLDVEYFIAVIQRLEYEPVWYFAHIFTNTNQFFDELLQRDVTKQPLLREFNPVEIAKYYNCVKDEVRFKQWHTKAREWLTQNQYRLELLKELDELQ